MMMKQPGKKKAGSSFFPLQIHTKQCGSEVLVGYAPRQLRMLKPTAAMERCAAAQHLQGFLMSILLMILLLLLLLPRYIFLPTI